MPAINFFNGLSPEFITAAMELLNRPEFAADKEKLHSGMLEVLELPIIRMMVPDDAVSAINKVFK